MVAELGPIGARGGLAIDVLIRTQPTLAFTAQLHGQLPAQLRGRGHPERQARRAARGPRPVARPRTRRDRVPLLLGVGHPRAALGLLRRGATAGGHGRGRGAQGPRAGAGVGARAARAGQRHRRAPGRRRRAAPARPAAADPDGRAPRGRAWRTSAAPGSSTPGRSRSPSWPTSRRRSRPSELFAAAQFFDLTDEEKISKPAFVPHRAGYVLEGSAFQLADTLVADVVYEESNGEDRPPAGSRHFGVLDVAFLDWAVLGRRRAQAAGARHGRRRAAGPQGQPGLVRRGRRRHRRGRRGVGLRSRQGVRCVQPGQRGPRRDGRLRAGGAGDERGDVHLHLARAPGLHRRDRRRRRASPSRSRDRPTSCAR